MENKVIYRDVREVKPGHYLIGAYVNDNLAMLYDGYLSRDGYVMVLYPNKRGSSMYDGIINGGKHTVSIYDIKGRL